MTSLRRGRRASANEATRRRGRRPLALAGALLLCLAAISAAGVAVAAVIGTPNHGHLVAVGPTSSDSGFPVWYKDDKGVRLEPCLDQNDPNCPSQAVAGAMPDPSKPVSFPDN